VIKSLKSEDQWEDSSSGCEIPLVAVMNIVFTSY
jgi:hypothetical protein